MDDMMHDLSLLSASRPLARLPAAPAKGWSTPDAMPFADEGFISSSVLYGFDALVAQLGGDPDELFERAGLDAEACRNLCDQIRFKDYALLLEIAADTLECSDFGMRLASVQSGTVLMGPVGAALERAGTIGELFRCCASYMHIFSTGIQIHLEAYPDAGEALLVFDVLARGASHRRQAIEQLLAIGYDDTLRFSGGAACAKEIWLAHEPLASLATYRKRFGCKLRFCEAYSAALFNIRDLKVPIVTRDELVFKNITSNLQREFPNTPSLSSRVHHEIIRTLHQDPCSREIMAHALGLNARTLHRHLKREGNTFEMIRDGVRRDLAEHYLAQSDASITEIAAWLGFAEPAVFSRACRRWFGACPSKMRQHFVHRQVDAREPVRLHLCASC